jgi:uncharacterized protein
MDFSERYGPWAVIAGASEGTGASFARQLAAMGLRLILVARREGPLAALADEIRAAHRVECVTASIDLSADGAADEMSALARGREVGLFVSNAGADANGSMFFDGDLANWDALVLRNVTTVLRACHHFGRSMRDRGRGGLLLVNSGACYSGLPGVGVYGATKAFNLVLGEALWAELRPHGVDVLNLVMTQTDTPAHRQLMQRLGMPIPQNMASADDVARIGLERLPHGPVHNWGLADDEVGFATSSAADRRKRVQALAEASAAYARAGRRAG